MKFTKLVKADNKEKMAEIEDLLLQVQKGLETAEYAANSLKNWIPVISFDKLKNKVNDSLDELYHLQRFVKNNKEIL